LRIRAFALLAAATAATGPRGSAAYTEFPSATAAGAAAPSSRALISSTTAAAEVAAAAVPAQPTSSATAAVADDVDAHAVADAHWQATIERLDTGAGLRAFLTSARVHQSLTLEPRHDEPEPWLVSNVAVAGRVRIQLSDGPSADVALDSSVIFRPLHCSAKFTPQPAGKLRLAGFMLSAERLGAMFGSEMPPILQSALAGHALESPLHPLPCTSRLRRLASSLFTTGLHGAMRLIFLEGVILQMIVEQARATYPTRGTAEHAGDRPAVARARERLFSDLRNPPSLGTLAAEVGLSEKALNAGFRATYGTTVFETFKDKRLEDARLLLRTEALPMKTVAFRVGYSHVSYFSRAFALKFGVSPLQFARRRD
jgi:AraC-like DNA-binding protein